ncbi:hypothetical protein YC2023_115788 [Brassica napus]
MLCYWLRRWANAIGQIRGWFNRADSGSYTMVFGKGISQYAEIRKFNQNSILENSFVVYDWEKILRELCASLPYHNLVGS